MEKRNHPKEVEERSDVENSSQVNYRNNNTSADDITVDAPNVERANSAGVGDSGVNDARQTKHTSNHSGDA